MKNVFAIIASYNGADWIDKCLSSLEQSSLLPKIIVIDNGSTDSTTSIIKEKFRNVQLIEPIVNLGFGQANNLGLKIALENKCDYAFLLNQDAWVEVDTLADLVEAFESKPKLGILSPVHLNGTGNALDIFFLDYLKRSDIGNYLQSQILNKKDSCIIIDTNFVNAAAWLISANCIKNIGGFDPIFFHYGEDINYAQRAIYQGFEIGIHLHSKIFHDREQRILNSPSNSLANFKRDWTNELNLFCDIHQKNYKSIIFKRILRNFFLLVICLLKGNRNLLFYHYKMLKSIFSSLNQIRISREISVNKNFMAHL